MAHQLLSLLEASVLVKKKSSSYGPEYGRHIVTIWLPSSADPCHSRP